MNIWIWMMTGLWLATSVACVVWGRNLRRCSAMFAGVLAENSVLQRQIRDALAWRQPHICSLPRGEKADDRGCYTIHAGYVWQCPECSLRWVAVGFEAVNTLTRRIDWVTEYERTTGCVPLFDPRVPRRALSVVPRATGAHRAASAPGGAQ